MTDMTVFMRQKGGIHSTESHGPSLVSECSLLNNKAYGIRNSKCGSDLGLQRVTFWGHCELDRGIIEVYVAYKGLKTSSAFFKTRIFSGLVSKRLRTQFLSTRDEYYF